MKMGALEHHNGVYNLEIYVIGYMCKGNDVSISLKSILKAITDEYCSHDCNSDKNVKSLIAKLGNISS